MTTRRTASRMGFTLTELMVALALIIFIMSILSAAFGAASKAVRDLKAAGDLAERLRGILSLMRRDLAARHLDHPPRRLGDGTWLTQMQPTSQGFFRIWQEGRPFYDPALAPATAMPTPDTAVTSPSPLGPTFVGTRLHFTSKLSGHLPGDFFATHLPTGHPFMLAPESVSAREARYQSTAGTEYRSAWAEIKWWVADSGETTPLDVNMPAGFQAGQKLYTIRRRQRLLWNDPTNRASVAGSERELSYPNTGGAVPGNTPSDITLPALRSGASQFMGTYLGAGPTLPHTARVTAAAAGNFIYPGLYDASAFPMTTNLDDTDDIVMTDVLSMDVAVLIQGMADFVDIGHPSVQAMSGNNPAFHPTNGPFVFDTWSRGRVGQLDYNLPDDALAPPTAGRWIQNGSLARVPLIAHIRAIRITIRIWDSKSNMTRQSTMIQEL